MTDNIIPTYRWDTKYGIPARQRELIQVGDPDVIFEGGRWNGDRFTNTTIVKTTKTQVTTAEGKRYYRSTGQEVGRANSRTLHALVPADDVMNPSIADAIEKAQKFIENQAAERAAKTARREALAHPFWNSADAESVAQVVTLMDAWKERADEALDRQLAEFRNH